MYGVVSRTTASTLSHNRGPEAHVGVCSMIAQAYKFLGTSKPVLETTINT